MTTVIEGFLAFATLPVCMGLALATLDLLRAGFGWGGRSRWLTFQRDFWAAGGLLLFIALVVQLIPVLVSRDWTLLSYITVLGAIVVRAVFFVLSVLLIDMLGQTLGRVGNAVRRYKLPGRGMSNVQRTTSEMERARDTEL